MKIGVLGTGDVGKALAEKLMTLGHEVKVGSRTKQNSKVLEWMSGFQGSSVISTGDFSEAAAFGTIIFNCTNGQHSLAVLTQAGVENLNGKILIDVSNPLDFSNGFPPTLSVCNTTSIGEEIQKTFPEVRVVKALNTVTNQIMIQPSLLSEDSDIFICGNGEEAKKEVSQLLESFGWKSIIDLGDITNARATEMYLIFWTRLIGVVGNPLFNIKVIRSA